MNVKINNQICAGEGCPLLVIAGPCVIESEGLMVEIAGNMKDITEELGLPYIFKASFDKANRSSVASFRGQGIQKGLRMLERIKNTFKIPVLTDIHEVYQVEPVAEVVDILQIPAFLCRQTDLLVAAGLTGKPVNVKKGQFLSPQEMRNVCQKVESTGNRSIMLTERGTFFGYNNLVVDYRALPIMKSFGYPVIFDATHSVQRPGGAGTSSSGERQFIEPLARAAMAVGCDGIFLETHPYPEKALSDGPNSIPLKDIKALLTNLLRIHRVTQSIAAEQNNNVPGARNVTSSEKIIINTDGCSKGNPGRAGIGVVFKDTQGKIIKKIHKNIGIATNNVSEYTALIIALETALADGYQEIQILADSELMVKQLKGQYSVKDANLKVLYDKVISLLKQFKTKSIQHIPRELNKEADELSNIALESN
jgi:2-dehydro-3-deoxyphosphooctonate aldolase (KDO 8-P synthase)